MKQMTSVDELLAEARALGPLLREAGAEAERTGRLPRHVWDAMRQAGILRLYVPASLGGHEIDPVTMTRVVEQITAFDSAAGWAVMVSNTVAWWCRFLPDEGVEEIYADGPDGFIATAFHPPVVAEAVAGGYRLSGRAPLASGAHDATWLMLTAVVHENGVPRMSGEAPEVVAAVFRASDATIHQTWSSLGMRGTDSNDVGIDDVFVPAARTFHFDPNGPNGSHYMGTLYRAPAFAAALATWSAAALSIARAALDEFRDLAQGKTPFVSTTTLRHRATAQGRFGRAEATVRAARALLYGTVTEAWQRAERGEVATLEQRIDLLMASVHAVQSSAAAIELVHGAAGTSGIYTRSPLERHFRDIQTLRHHGFMSENRYETVGQGLLGLEPDLGLVAF